MGESNLCGEDTPNGPCTMPKGHAALFHRHRVYDTMLYYRIKTKDGAVVNNGKGKVPLGYAISEALKNNDYIIIEIESGRGD